MRDGINAEGPINDKVCPKCKQVSLYGNAHIAIYHDSYYYEFCWNQECDYVKEEITKPMRS